MNAKELKGVLVEIMRLHAEQPDDSQVFRKGVDAITEFKDGGGEACIAYNILLQLYIGVGMENELLLYLLDRVGGCCPKHMNIWETPLERSFHLYEINGFRDFDDYVGLLPGALPRDLIDNELGRFGIGSRIEIRRDNCTICETDLMDLKVPFSKLEDPITYAHNPYIFCINKQADVSIGDQVWLKVID